jgi:FkbH-like protein
VTVTTSTTPAVPLPEKPKRGRIKCIVWDLDNTLWNGVLLEDGDVTVRPAVVERIHELDRKGVLHSIASKNDRDAAMEKLRALGLEEMFLHPQINWNPKSDSIRHLAKALNLGLDAFAFVDDQEFERAEVAHGVPEVTCVDILELDEALARPEFRRCGATCTAARSPGRSWKASSSARTRSSWPAWRCRSPSPPPEGRTCSAPRS